MDGLNLYAYVHNNPVNLVDPYGLWQVTLGGGYGLAGRITFGKNDGRWNVGGAFGYGIGAMADFTPEDSASTFDSDCDSANLGVEVSGGVKLLGTDVGAGVRARVEANEAGSSEVRAGLIGGATVPGSYINASGSADVVLRKDADCDSVDAYGEVTSGPVSYGAGGMIFGGVTGGYEWK
jgi:hypothetical protein